MVNQAPAEVPTSFGKQLRACLRCRLLKTLDQFRESGCENCPFFDTEIDQGRVRDCTTPNFSGTISIVYPNQSWAARWLRITDYAPGCYALAVSEELPDDRRLCVRMQVLYMYPQNSEGAEILFNIKSFRHIYFTGITIEDV